MNYVRGKKECMRDDFRQPARKKTCRAYSYLVCEMLFHYTDQPEKKASCIKRAINVNYLIYLSVNLNVGFRADQMKYEKLLCMECTAAV